VVAAVTTVRAQASSDSWHHLSALPAGTHVHISSDKHSRTCYFQSSDDAHLICTRGHSSGTSYTFSRSEVRTVKLTRYGLSALAGMGIGAGAGLAIGAAAAPRSSTSSFDLSGIGRPIDIAISGVIGFLAGGAIGGPTDFLRGPVVYRRPGQ
jgi:hypothetical protein